jgi:hypothetical protein
MQHRFNNLQVIDLTLIAANIWAQKSNAMI